MEKAAPDNIKEKLSRGEVDGHGVYEEGNVCFVYSPTMETSRRWMS
jgi:hypothetical protein